MENAFRRVDAAHLREQQAQESLAEAERQIARMRQNADQTTRPALECDELVMSLLFAFFISRIHLSVRESRRRNLSIS
jgi:hypothetical protein